MKNLQIKGNKKLKKFFEKQKITDITKNKIKITEIILNLNDTILHIL